MRLIFWLGLSVALILLDARTHALQGIRQYAALAVQPLWRLAGLPSQLGHAMRSDAATRSQLSRDNALLHNALLISSARLARLEAVAAENARLREMLGVVRQGEVKVQLAPILDIDLDPTRQRLVLGAGSRDGVLVGQSVIDAGGLLGQVIEVQSGTATVLLLTDPGHAVPVEVVRSGVRLVAYGQGRHIALGNIPRNTDIQIGDVVQTSGLGGRFPAGFPVGTVTGLRPDESRSLMMADLQPAAAFDRGREVLLLRELPPAPAPLAPPISTETAGDVAPPNSQGTPAAISPPSTMTRTGNALTAPASAPAPSEAENARAATSAQTAPEVVAPPADQASTGETDTPTQALPRTEDER